MIIDDKKVVKRQGDIVTTRLINTKAPYIQYIGLEATGIVHNAFSTRLGGVSGGVFESMNFSEKMGDSGENVRRNFEIFMRENGFENPVLSDQTHTVNVRRVTSGDIGKGIYRNRDYSDIDGLITNERGITLVTSYADCVPLYFADTKNRAIGLSHSGWRGTVARMGEHTLRAMEEAFGTKPEDIVAAIGPSICANCYEVSGEVASWFMEEFAADAADYPDSEAGRKKIPQNMNTIVYRKKARDNEGGSLKYMLNLWAANYMVLTEAGVLPDNIIIPDICTCCNKELLFSHRGHHGRRGNMCAFLCLI